MRMRTIMIIVVLICSAVFIGCKSKGETNPNLTDTHQAIELDKRAWSTAFDTSVMVTSLTPEIEKQFPNIKDYSDVFDPERQKIIFATTGKGVNFGFVEVQIVFNEVEEEFYLVVTREILTHFLTPQTPLSVDWVPAGLFPYRGFFVEENKVRRYFSINSNDAGPDEDGSYAPVMIMKHEECYATEGLNFSRFSFFDNKLIPWNIHDKYEADHDMSTFEGIEISYDGKVHELKPAGYDLSVSGWVDFADYVLFVDYNFDGYMDIGFDNGHASGIMNPRTLVYLYNPKSKTFQQNEVLSEISNLSIDSDKKIICEHHVGIQSEYAIRQLKWENNQFTVVYHEFVVFDNGTDMFDKTTRTLKNDGKYEENTEKLTFEQVRGDER